MNHVIDFEQIQKIDTAKWLAEVQHTDEAKEGISAFFEKRKPNWAPSKD